MAAKPPKKSSPCDAVGRDLRYILSDTGEGGDACGDGGWC